MTRAKTQQKIKDALVGLPIPIQLHLVNLPHCFDARALRQLFRSADPVSAGQRIGYMSAAKFKHIYDVRLNTVRGSLNVVYIENEGENRFPLTPWIIAHRLYHALALAAQHRSDAVYPRLSDDLIEMLAAAAEIYRYANRCEKGDGRPCPAKPFITASAAREAGLKYLAEQIFDTKVCRHNRLNNPLEAIAEAFAQWCVTGNIRTRALPRRLLWSARTCEASAQDTDRIHQDFLGLILRFKEVFAVELGKALHAGQRLLVF